MSKSGHVCKSWVDRKNTLREYIGNYWYQDMEFIGYFPDGSLENAANYCRSPDNDSDGPWCYVNDDNDDWEHCDVPPCNGNESIISNFN